MSKEETATLDDTVRKGETEVGGEKLLDVGTTNIGSLLDFGNTKDLSVGGRHRSEAGAKSRRRRAK